MIIRAMATLACLCGAGALTAGCTLARSPFKSELAPPAVSTDYSIADWQAVLKEYVRVDGVDYGGLAKRADHLSQFMRAMERSGPDSQPAMFEASAARLAYWLNAYNAAVLTAVIDAGTPPTMHDPAQGPFRDRQRFRLDRKMLTLNEVRERIRAESRGDPRVWSCLSDAARGSPPLLDQPFEATRLPQQLEEAARRAMADPNLVRVDHAAGELLLGVPIIENRDELVDYCVRTTGNSNADLLDAVIALAGKMRGAWFATARGYAVKIIPFETALNISSI